MVIDAYGLNEIRFVVFGIIQMKLVHIFIIFSNHTKIFFTFSLDENLI